MAFAPQQQPGDNVGGGNMNDLLNWYNEIPVISRVYLTAAIGTTTACFMDLISPFTLYYNYDLIVHKQQFWRIFSSFIFLGSFSLDFLFHLYFVVRYCRLLEEGPYRGRRADFIFMLLFGAFCMLIVVACTSTFNKMKFLGHPFGLMMVYIWSRWPDNIHVRMSLLGIFQFTAPYLPWVILLFSLFLGNPIETDLLGIIVGHIYYYLDSIYPQVADIRGWRIRRILVTPKILHYFCGSLRQDDGLLNVIIQEMPVDIQAPQQQQQQNVPDPNANGNNANGNGGGHLHQD